MSAFDVAVVGSPFVDLTFEGLPRLPGPGEELVGRALHVGPGGTGMQAVAAARLGLRTALVSPIGRDPGAEILRATFAAEGVSWLGHPSDATPTTAILSTRDGTAMATALGDDEPTAEDVAAADARALVLSLGRLHLRPAGAAVYATTGTIEIDRGAALPPADAARGVCALVVNAREAAALAAVDDPEAAALRLTEGIGCVVVTLGAEGALAVEHGRVTHADAPAAEVVDATGAGDLFIAAYVWADLAGFDLDARLAWATLYAGLSVRSPTPFEGALNLDDLVAEGHRRGLRLPP